MAIAEKTDVIVAPFGIEYDHPRNSDGLIQAIPGLRLRGAISAGKVARDYKTGISVIPIGQASFLGQLPSVPGMQLHVNPAKLAYTVIDPLEENEELCEQIRSAINRQENTAIHIQGRLKGVPSTSGTIDVNRMKTLVREMLWLVEANEAKVVKGSCPTLDQIQQMPGKFLLNPGSRIFNTQPQFEEDWVAWVERLTKAGG
jgi:hypothetical protein